MSNTFDVTLEGTFRLGPAPVTPPPILRTVRFDASLYPVHEGSSVLIVARTDRPFTAETYVIPVLDTVNTTAASTDYEWRSGQSSFRFTPGSLVAAIELRALTDALLLESTESVYLDLFASGDPGAEGYNVDTPSRTRIQIFNTSNPRVNFALTETTFEEGNGLGLPTGSYYEFLVEVNISSAPVDTVTVEVLCDYANGTLAYGPDLVAPPEITVLTFTPTGPLSQYVTVRSRYDIDVESDESVDLILQNITGTATIGTQDTHTITVLNDDDLEVEVAFTASSASIEEGQGTGATIFVTNLSGDPQPNHGGLRIPVSVGGTANAVPNTANQDVVISWPGGINRAVIVPPGATQVTIGVNSLEDSTTESNETVSLTLAAYNSNTLIGGVASNPYTLGAPTAHTTTIVNDDFPNPEVEFSAASFSPIYEAGQTFAEVNVIVTNPTTTNINQTFSVGIAYSGTATLGTDYYVQIDNEIISSTVTFEPGQTSITVRFIAINDSIDEAPSETIIATLTGPTNCTIGDVSVCSGTVVDDEVPASGTTLRPQFYFWSEVFGAGPNDELLNNTVPMVVDLGENVSFPEEIQITMEAYSPNAVEGLDYEFPSGKVMTIAANSRYGTLNFRALAAGLVGAQKWVVVRMASTTHGVVSGVRKTCRWTAVLLGNLDTKGVIPPAMSSGSTVNNMPSTADYQVYTNQIVDVAHGKTYPLPWPGVWSTLANAGAGWTTTLRDEAAAIYGAIVTSNMSGGDNDRYNGICIAAQLAQKLWIQRNNPTKTVADSDAFGPYAADGTTWLITPHVKWLDRGYGVRIDVMENLVPARSGLYFGGKAGHDLSGRKAGVISWNDHHTNAGNFAPGICRDLWIRGNGGTRTIGEVYMLATKSNNASNTNFAQFFMDNVHLDDLAVTVDGTAVQYWMFTGGYDANREGTDLAHGIIYLDGVDFTNSTTPFAGMQGYRNIRANFPASWDIRNCTGTYCNHHILYLEQVGPIFRVYNNTVPAPGNGVSFLQLVSRPRVGGDIDGRMSGPNHGLCALVANEVWGNTLANANAGFDFYIVGHTGYIFFVANKHRGILSAGNRGLLKLNARGNQSGMYGFQSPPGSGPIYLFRYALIDEVDAQLGTGTWNADPFEFSGCQYLDIGTTTAMTSSSSLGTRPVFSFNTDGANNPTPASTAVCTDPLNVPLWGIGTTIPRERTPNKGGLVGSGAGGVRFVDGWVNAFATGFGSSRKGQHLRIAYINWQELYMGYNGVADPGAPAAPAPVHDLFSSYTNSQLDAYTGTDLS